MQIIAIVRRRTETYTEEQFAPLLEPEAQAVRAFYIDGTLRAVWSRGDKLGAVLLLECDSLEHAQRKLATLPLFERDMAEVEMLIPMRGYRGFAPRE